MDRDPYTISKLSAKYKLCAIYTADSTDGKVTEADNFSRPDKLLHDTGYILTTGPVYDATQPSRTDQLTLSRRRHPDLAILSNHLIDRKVRANSQEEVTPRKPKGIFPGCQQNLTAKSTNHQHLSVTFGVTPVMLQPKKLANNVELMMSYNFRSVGKVSFVIRVSIRFNGVSVMVMKQGIVPCKLLIAASEITVFLGSIITDVTPIFLPSEALTIPPPKKNLPAGLM